MKTRGVRLLYPALTLSVRKNFFKIIAGERKWWAVQGLNL
ncbi:MAG: hypothetical protein ACRBDL_01485 [Alphaproteobacteria bacterium]